jgi:asparagine synthase (glutamine-hydrolysing)
MIQYFAPDYRAMMGAAYMTPALARMLKKDFVSDNALLSRKETYASLTGTVFDKQVKYEMLTFLPDLLLRQDKMSMAHSIENRVPFLDNDLVEKSFQIPVQHLIGESKHGFETKLALKAITTEVFGEPFSYRAKAGFGIPLRDFFSDEKFKTYLMDEVLPSMAARGLFDVQRIAQWIKNIKTINSQELDALWIMVAFETWAKRFNLSA